MDFLRNRFQSSKNVDELYRKYNKVSQVENHEVRLITHVITDLAALRGCMPKDNISDYSYLQRLLDSMHPRLREAVEPLIEEDEDIDTISGIVERHDSTLRKNNSYGRVTTSRSEQRPKQAKQGKRVTPTKGKERSTQPDNPKRDKESRVCYEC